MAGVIQGVATITAAVDSHVLFSYPAGGGALCLNIGFIPSYITMNNGTSTWAWARGVGFGNVLVSSPTASTGGVLDVLDGSGIATANIATTTKAIGLVVGTSTAITNGGTYLGLAFR